jgi:hypothetical protein
MRPYLDFRRTAILWNTGYPKFPIVHREDHAQLLAWPNLVVVELGHGFLGIIAISITSQRKKDD